MRPPVQAKGKPAENREVSRVTLHNVRYNTLKCVQQVLAGYHARYELSAV